MKQIIVFSALAVSIISTAFTLKENPMAANQSSVVSAANDFDFVRGHRQGKNITVTWGMTANAGLVGFDIEKTNQDPNDPYSVWEDVASVPGSNARSYKYTDMNAFPGLTNYRITAWYADSRSSTSEIITVKIVAH